MAGRTSMVNITTDMAPVAEFAQYSEGMAEFFSNPRTRDRIAARTAETAKNQFNLMVDTLAEHSPKRLGHMYEWKHVGEADARLWQIVINPSGQQGRKIADWFFLESHDPVPQGQAETGIQDDTRSRKHVFRWKAAVTEEGHSVQISPSGANMLAMPIMSAGKMFFTQDTVTEAPPEQMVGQFTNLWVDEFAVIAEKTAERDIGASAERFITRENSRLAHELSHSNAAHTNIKPRKNMKARALDHGEKWLDEVETVRKAERYIE